MLWGRCAYWLGDIPHVLSCVCISWWHLGNGSDLKYVETRPDWRIVRSSSDFPSSVVKHHRYLWTVSKTLPWETPDIAQNIWCQVTRAGVDFLSPVYRPRPTDRGVTVILLSSSFTTGESRQLACCGAMPCNIQVFILCLGYYNLRLDCGCHKASLSVTSLSH